MNQVDVKIFHHYYNNQFYSQNNSNMYLIIETMLRIQSESNIKLNSIKKYIINVIEKTPYINQILYIHISDNYITNSWIE